MAAPQGGEAAGAGAEAGAGQLPAPQKLGKDPSVHTDFLPDQERDAQEVAVRAQLRKEYELRQKVKFWSGWQLACHGWPHEHVARCLKYTAQQGRSMQRVAGGACGASQSCHTLLADPVQR